MIPKIIHYCWLSGDPIPEDLQAHMKSWKEKLIDYEFILWDRNRFDINQCKWVKEAYEKKKYAFAADYIRLYALYNYGGIYMDMDVEVIKSFDDMLEKDYILGYESSYGIEAGIIGSIPKAEWLKTCLLYYDGRPFIKKNGKMDTYPLPWILYNIITKDYTNFKILSHDYLTTKSLEDGEIRITANTHTIHHFAGSWCDWRLKLKRFLFLQIIKSKILYTINKMTYRKLHKRP